MYNITNKFKKMVVSRKKGGGFTVRSNKTNNKKMKGKKVRNTVSVPPDDEHKETAAKQMLRKARERAIETINPELRKKVSEVNLQSNKYQTEKLKQIANFKEFLENSEKWCGKLMEPVLFANSEVASNLFQECAIFDGIYPKDKIELVNKALCDYITNM